jgi:hypothetical protein
MGVTCDPDLVRDTKLLIDQRGENAALRAAGRADQLLEAGDMIWAATLRRLLRAADKLRHGRQLNEPLN